MTTYAPKIIEKAEQIIKDARAFAVADGEAMYLVGDRVELGRDGRQPSNSMCLAVGPTDDEDWSELQHAVILWLIERE